MTSISGTSLDAGTYPAIPQPQRNRGEALGETRAVKRLPVPRLDLRGVEDYLPAYLAVPVKRLPERQRQAVLYVHVLGCTEEEAAREMGIARGVVSKALTSAVDGLKNLAQNISGC